MNLPASCFVNNSLERDWNYSNVFQNAVAKCPSSGHSILGNPDADSGDEEKVETGGKKKSTENSTREGLLLSLTTLPRRMFFPRASTFSSSSLSTPGFPRMRKF